MLTDEQTHILESVSVSDSALRRYGIPAVILPGVLLLAGAVFVEPVPQSDAYHEFADRQTRLRIPNFGDVVTNFPFLLIGLAGIQYVRGSGCSSAAFARAREGLPWVTFFLGLLLTGMGSTWYHLRPDNARLVWDRLPITLATMGIFSALVAERINRRAGVALLAPLVLIGAAGVWWWRWTELQGHGDLRWYAVVSLYPVMALPLLLLLFRARYTHGNYYWAILLWYLLARGGELLDREILDFTHCLSGHNLKHLCMAAAAFTALRMLKVRSGCPPMG